MLVQTVVERFTESGELSPADAGTAASPSEQPQSQSAFAFMNDLAALAPPKPVIVQPAGQTNLWESAEEGYQNAKFPASKLFILPTSEVLSDLTLVGLLNGRLVSVPRNIELSQIPQNLRLIEGNETIRIPRTDDVSSAEALRRLVTNRKNAILVHHVVSENIAPEYPRKLLESTYEGLKRMDMRE